MNRKRVFRRTGTGRRILSFLFAFVWLFSASGISAYADNHIIYSEPVTAPDHVIESLHPEEAEVEPFGLPEADETPEESNPIPEWDCGENETIETEEESEPQETEELPEAETGDDETTVPGETPDTAEQTGEQEENPTEDEAAEQPDDADEGNEIEAEPTTEPDPERIWYAGSLTAETDGCTVRIDYPAEARIDEAASLTLETAKGAELYTALKSAAKVIRNEENETWNQQVSEDGNLFYVLKLTDPEGNEILPAAGMNLICEQPDNLEGVTYFLTGSNARILEKQDGVLFVNNYYMEPFGYATVDRIQTGTVTQEYQAADYLVTATYGPEAGFPSDTEMKVREIQPGTPEYALYSGMTEETLGEEWSEITLERYFDISFVSNGKEVEPQADVDMQIIFKNVIELTEEHDVQTVHIENNEAKLIESETDSNEDAAKQSGEVIDTVSFTSDSFSVYGVVQRTKISQKVLAADGNTYEISVTYSQDAAIPADAELVVTELQLDDARYAECLQKAVRAALIQSDLETPGKDEGVYIAEDQYGRFFDIEIRSGGQKIEPEGSVTVKIGLVDAPEERLDGLMVVHFTEDNTDILSAEVNEETEIQFEANSFSVYGVITYPDAQPQGVDDLDGRSFTINRNGRYLTDNVVGEGSADRFEGTFNAGDAAILTFEATGETGRYNIFVTDSQGNKQYLQLDRRDANRAHAKLGSEPQSFTVTKNSNGTYSFSATSKDTLYYLNDFNNENGFAGWYQKSSNDEVTVTFTDMAASSGKNYMTLVKYNDKYYTVDNDGSLTEVQYDPATKKVTAENPLLWNYQTSGQGTNLRIVTEGKTFNGPGGVADTFYYRYIDAKADSGIYTEDASHQSGASESGFVFENGHIKSTDGTAYLGVEVDASGNPVRIAGNKGANEAVEVLFASVENVTVPSHSARNHSVSHLDVSVHGSAMLDYPLPRGKYYDANGNELYTITRDNPKSVTIQDNVPISKEDIKNAEIIAVDKDGNEIKNAYYVTGYTGNEGDNDPNLPTQIRIEGSFLVASNVTTAYPSDWTDEEDNRWNDLKNNSTHQAIRSERLSSEITYTVTTTKMVTFTLKDGDQILYDADGQPITVEVPVSMTGSCSYWSKKNTCPGITYNGGFGNDGPWASGCIVGGDGIDSTGIDFTLGGATKQEANAYPSVDITKYIVDGNGVLIQTQESFANSFTVYQIENTTQTSVCNSDYSAYTEETKLAVQVSGGVGKNYYDLNVDGAMIYIEEDKASIPATVTANGTVWYYVKTVIETEYARRADSQPNHKTGDLTMDGNEHYNSVPELAGKYKYNNEDRNNAILNFYVYNVYEALTDIRVTKTWSDDAGHYENDEITLRLIRYKKDAPLPPVKGTLNIIHDVVGLNSLPEGFTATYTYSGPESGTVTNAGAIQLDPGEYMVTVEVTNSAAPTGYTYAGTTGSGTVTVPEDGTVTATFTSTYTESITEGTITLAHNVNGDGLNAVPSGFIYIATNEANKSFTLHPGDNTLPLGKYTITVNDSNVSHPTDYTYNGTTVSGSPVTISESNLSGTVNVMSSYVPKNTTIIVHVDASNAQYSWYGVQMQTVHSTGWVYSNNNWSIAQIDKDTVQESRITVPVTDNNNNPYSYEFTINYHSFGMVEITASDSNVTINNRNNENYATISFTNKPGTIHIYFRRSRSGMMTIKLKDVRYRASAGMTSGGGTRSSVSTQNIPEGYGIDEDGYVTFTLKRGENWTKLIEDLDILDERGEPYYYGIEEVPAPGYTSSYNPADPVIATQDDVEFTVHNELITDIATENRGLTVYKTDGKDPLAGAVFELYQETTAPEGTATQDGTEANSNISVIKTYSMGNDTSFEIRTDDPALASLLPDVGESITIKLKETTPPTGYKEKTETWDVVFSTTQESSWNADHTAWTTTTVHNIQIGGQDSLTVPNAPIRTISVNKLVTDHGAASDGLDEKTIRFGLFPGDDEPADNAVPAEGCIGELTISGSSASGKLFEDLAPGKYWVYELDENDHPMKDGKAYVVVDEKNGNRDTYTVQEHEPFVTLTNPGDEETITITNNKEGTGSLTVKKMLAGEDAIMTDRFHFTVTQTSQPKLDGTYGSMTFDNGVATFELGHDESLTAEGLPYGFTYTVTEQEADENDYITVILPESNLTVETVDEEGEPLIRDEADWFIKTDETETVTVTNTRMLKKSIRVTKEYMGIPYEETENLPAITFSLWQAYGNGWGHTRKYETIDDDENDDTDYNKIKLSYENHWTWECKVELPEEDEDGNIYGYFVVENPIPSHAQGSHGVGDVIDTDPLIDEFPITIEGYQYREVKDVGRWSSTVHFQQANRAAVPNHGEIKILNKTPGYMQMDLKKKFLEYRPDGNGSTSLYTTTGETEAMRDMIIELQMMRIIIDDSTGQDVFLTGWKEYGVPVKVGYDTNGQVRVENDNAFRVENSGGSWHFQIVDNNHYHGLPTKGLYKKDDGSIIVVRYRYVFKEVQVYDGNLNPKGGQWVAWLPYAKDGNGQMYKVSELQTAQDQDRMLNAPATSLSIEKEWVGSSRRYQEVYIKVGRREAGTNGTYEDYLAVLNEEMGLGNLTQKHFGSNNADVFDSDNNQLVLNAENGWKAVIDKVQVFPLGNNHKQYEYRIVETGYKDKNGNIYNAANVITTFEPVYHMQGQNDNDWVEMGEDEGLLLTVNGPNKLKVTNTAPYGALEIIKQVPEVSNEAAEGKTFTFSVTLTIPSGTAFSEDDLSIEDGTISGFAMSGDTATFTVTRRGAGNAVIDGIPYGSTYEVTESNMPDGWKQEGGTVYSDSTQTVTREDTNTDTATITNKEITTVTVEKIWMVNGQTAGWQQDAEITAGLYQSVNNGEPEAVIGENQAQKTVAFGKNATAEDRTFTELSVYDAQGQRIAYSIRELSVTNAQGTAAVTDDTVTFAGKTWLVSVSSPDQNGKATITNSRTEIHILKVDVKNNEPLAGAEFRLDKNSGTTWEVLQNGIAVGTEGDDKGRATVEILEDGEYRLSETKSPPGYIPLGKPAVFTVENGAVSFENTGFVTYDKDTATFTVQNKTGLALPTTGGSGTQAYTAGGLAMALFAGLLLLNRRRKKLQ